MKRQAEGKEKEIALIEFQIAEIEETNIGDSEEEALKERLKVLKSAEKIDKVFEEISEGLEASDNSARSMLKAVRLPSRRFRP